MNITVTEARTRGYHELQDNEPIKAGDLIEWTEGALSDILEGSPYVDVLPARLPIPLNFSHGRAKVYRRTEAA